MQSSCALARTQRRQHGSIAINVNEKLHDICVMVLARIDFCSNTPSSGPKQTFMPVMQQMQ
jgi:hypothetical protein